MGSIPVLKPSELIEILSKLGVEVVRQRCSHQQFRDANGRCSPWPHRINLSIEQRYGQPTYLLDKWFLISVPGR